MPLGASRNIGSNKPVSVAHAIDAYKGDLLCDAAEQSRLRCIMASALEEPLEKLTPAQCSKLYHALVVSGCADRVHQATLAEAQRWGQWLAARKWVTSKPWEAVTFSITPPQRATIEGARREIALHEAGHAVAFSLMGASPHLVYTHTVDQYVATIHLFSREDNAPGATVMRRSHRYVPEHGSVAPANRRFYRDLLVARKFGLLGGPIATCLDESADVSTWRDDERNAHDAAHYEELSELSELFTSDGENEALALLRPLMPAVREVASALLRENYLRGAAVDAIVDRHATRRPPIASGLDLVLPRFRAVAMASVRRADVDPMMSMFFRELLSEDGTCGWCGRSLLDPYSGTTHCVECRNDLYVLQEAKKAELVAQVVLEAVLSLADEARSAVPAADLSCATDYSAALVECGLRWLVGLGVVDRVRGGVRLVDVERVNMLDVIDNNPHVDVMIVAPDTNAAAARERRRLGLV